MSTQATMDDMHRGVRDVVKANSGLFVAQGVILTVLGFAAVIWPQISSLAVDVYAGWLFLFSGITGLVMMFFAPSVGGFLWTLLTSALALFAGALLLWHPVEGVVSLTLVLVAFFIAEGLFQVAAGFTYRSAFPDSWAWMLMSGVVDLLLAGIIITGWPGSASWALGIVVGANLISSGVATLMLALAAREVASGSVRAVR